MPLLDQQVLELFRSYASPDLRPAVSLDSHLYKDLGLNSYDYMSLLGELESQMRLEIDIADVMHAQTVADVVAALKEGTSCSEGTL
ncbi:MAG: acyl carrier protein [Micrococcales bacterium]|nr:acyl carrier protein [Micrococcales bacterium]MCL2666364.1 acyl carrier protein [Micrococcales bacterium]